METLSGGQRQGVAVARAAAFGSKVVILDEPTAALGVKESRKVLDLIQDVRARGMPIVLISHNMPHVFEVADRIHIHRLGRRLCVDRPEGLHHVGRGRLHDRREGAAARGDRRLIRPRRAGGRARDGAAGSSPAAQVAPLARAGPAGGRGFLSAPDASLTVRFLPRKRRRTKTPTASASCGGVCWPSAEARRAGPRAADIENCLAPAPRRQERRPLNSREMPVEDL